MAAEANCRVSAGPAFGRVRGSGDEVIDLLAAELPEHACVWHDDAAGWLQIAL